jgi:signal transduction histidine kinase
VRSAPVVGRSRCGVRRGYRGRQHDQRTHDDRGDAGQQVEALRSLQDVNSGARDAEAGLCDPDGQDPDHEHPDAEPPHGVDGRCGLAQDPPGDCQRRDDNGPAGRARTRVPSFLDAYHSAVFATRRLVMIARPDRLDGVMVLTLAVLVAVSAAVALAPRVGGQYVEAGLDLFLDTFATVVTLGVAVVAWVRYRESGAPVALFQSAAFLALAVVGCASLLFVVGRLDVFFADFGQDMPRDAQPQITAVGHLLAACLLLAGGALSLGRRRVPRPWIFLLGPSALLLVLIQSAPVWSPSVPPLSGVFILPNPQNWSSIQPLPPAPTDAGVAVHLLCGLVFLVAAELTRRLHRRQGTMGDAFLAVGLVFAAFGEFHTAFFPGTFGGIITTGDVLLVAFAVVILIGIEAEARATRAALGRANETLGQLKDAEVRRAALEERTRLSRELHDGLAQDLWLAKLKVGRLALAPDLGDSARAVCDEVAGAIDTGLADARQAVMTLRLGSEPAVSLQELVARQVDDFADRFGLRAEFVCDGDLPRLAPRSEAELLRIAQEALNNVARHADATVVRVKASVVGSSLELVVGDNGRGFEPGEVPDGSFGLASMRERAQLIGGELTIDSAPQDGTRIRVRVPLVNGTAGMDRTGEAEPPGAAAAVAREVSR